MIFEIFVRSKVCLFVVNEAGSEGEHPPLCFAFVLDYAARGRIRRHRWSAVGGSKR